MNDHPTRAEKRAATAQRIFDAAQVEFGEHGMEGATIRGIAARAHVDPSLVLQHYGTKQGLFELAVRPAPDLTEEDIPHHLSEVLDIRLHELPPATRALMRSMLTSPAVAEIMNKYLVERMGNLARASSRDDAELRAAIVVSSILGITVARHFLGLHVLDDLDHQLVSSITEPWFASFL